MDYDMFLQESDPYYNPCEEDPVMLKCQVCGSDFEYKENEFETVCGSWDCAAVAGLVTGPSEEIQKAISFYLKRNRSRLIDLKQWLLAQTEKEEAYMAQRALAYLRLHFPEAA